MNSLILVPALSTWLLAAALPTAPVAAPGGRWAVDFGDYECSLARHAGGSQALVVKRGPASASVQVHWVDPDWYKAARSPSPELFLEPGHVRVEDFVPRPLEQDQGVGSFAVGSQFLDRLAVATTADLHEGGKIVGSIRVPEAARALRAFSECNDSLVRDFGGDPALLKSLREPPRTASLATLISSDDYPSDALQDEASGIVRFRLDVGADGKIQGCAINVSSGRKDFDEATCRIMKSRARFEPAVGADGKPAAAPYFYWVAWRIR